MTPPPSPAPMTYSSYLMLDTLLSAQKPRSHPEHHDEMLFIVQHQTSELWFKLIIHELHECLRRLRGGDLLMPSKIIARVKTIQAQLYSQWQVLATMTPAEYSEFRTALRSASGFQSVQYRVVEFLLGEKDPAMLKYHEEPQHLAMLREALATPTLYDEFLRLLARRGLPVPREVLERDVTQAYVPSEGVTACFRTIYQSAISDDEGAGQPGGGGGWWDAYDFCEKLVDLDEQFAHWRFRHYKTVQRIIGTKPGTGGSSGTAYLSRRFDKSFFPELIDVRTTLPERKQG